MALTLEMAPETQRALEEKAARLGVPVENYALTILRRDLDGETGVASTRDEEPSYFAVVDALRADLKNSGFQGVDSAQIIREAREERTAQILGEGRDDD